MMKLLLNSIFNVSKSILFPIAVNVLKLIFPLIIGSAIIILPLMLVFRVLAYFGLEREGYRLSYGSIRMLRAIISGAITASLASDLELERKKKEVKEEEERLQKEEIDKKMALKQLEDPNFKRNLDTKLEEAASQAGGLTAVGSWAARQLGVSPTDILSYFGRRQ